MLLELDVSKQTVFFNLEPVRVRQSVCVGGQRTPLWGYCFLGNQKRHMKAAAQPSNDDSPGSYSRRNETRINLLWQPACGNSELFNLEVFSETRSRDHTVVKYVLTQQPLRSWTNRNRKLRQLWGGGSWTHTCCVLCVSWIPLTIIVGCKMYPNGVAEQQQMECFSEAPHRRK